MKKLALVLLGLFLAGMAITCIVHADLVTMIVGIALALWAIAIFRKVWQMPVATPTNKPRPWEG